MFLKNAYILIVHTLNRGSLCITPNSLLERLDVSHCIIEDDVAIGIAGALHGNRMLKNLGIGSSSHMTIAGFRAFAALLQSPDCVLEILNLGHDQVNDEVVIMLTNALANNHTLKTLCLTTAQSNERYWSVTRTMTSAGWDALLNLVCNVSSIEDTYQSNHTLYISIGHHSLPGNIDSYFRLNKGNEPKDAARKKILKAHFTEKIDMQRFIDMDLGVLPHFLAWMGRDGTEISTSMYLFVGNMPLIYDFCGGLKPSDNVQKKQKVV